MWEPPQGEDAEMPGLVAERLADLGARPWQVDLTRDLLSDAILSPEDVTETAVPS